MSIIQKGTIFVFPIIWLILFLLPAFAMDADDAPESVLIDSLEELYEPVEFDHLMHSDMYDCNSCHHHTTGTGAANELCAKCHINPEPSDEVSCSACHEVAITPPASSLYHIDKPSLKGALHLQCAGCHRSEGGPIACQDCHSFTAAGRKRFAIQD